MGGIGSGKSPFAGSISMAKVLTPEQCRRMSRFLFSLNKYASETPNPDIGGFINKWQAIHGTVAPKVKPAGTMFMCLCCGWGFDGDKNHFPVYCSKRCKARHIAECKRREGIFKSATRCEANP